jgi:hypothetical protein
MTSLTGILSISRQHRLVLNECFIAGFRYHEGTDILHELRAGDEVQLVAEPTNAYDAWAVRIERSEKHVGYLPRTQNEPISRLLQQGIPISCRITQVDAQAPTWEAVHIQASLVLDRSGFLQGFHTARRLAG